MGTRWGLTLPLPGISLADHEEHVKQAEAAGYTGLLDRPGSPSGAISLDLGFWLAFAGSVLMIVGGGMAAGQTERARKPPGVL